MFEKTLLKAMVKEMKIYRRLYTKVPAGHLAFKPKEGTRTTLKSMQHKRMSALSMLQ
jgi:hypothetical protein